MFGVKDIDRYFLENVDDRTLLSLCQTNKALNTICNDEQFWKKKAKKRFLYEFIELNKKKDMTWKNFYLNSIYMNWREVIFKALTSVGSDNKITKNAVTYLQELFEPVYEKINDLPNIGFRENLDKLLGVLGKHAISVMGQNKYESYNYYKQYDRRKIIEYLLSEIIELSINPKTNLLTTNSIKKRLAKDEDFFFLRG